MAAAVRGRRPHGTPRRHLRGLLPAGPVRRGAGAALLAGGRRRRRRPRPGCRAAPPARHQRARQSRPRPGGRGRRARGVRAGGGPARLRRHQRRAGRHVRHGDRRHRPGRRWTSEAALLGGGRAFDFSLRAARAQAWRRRPSGSTRWAPPAAAPTWPSSTAGSPSSPTSSPGRPAWCAWWRGWPGGLEERDPRAVSSALLGPLASPAEPAPQDAL